MSSRGLSAPTPTPNLVGPERRPVLKALGLTLGAGLVGGAIYDAGSGAEGSSARSNLTLIAPGAAGGGWDGAAREIQQVLRATSVVNNSQVVNIPGAGGTIGLSQFVTKLKGNPTNLMMMGMVMLGAIEVNKSTATLAQTTPIARLTDDYNVIVVPAKSAIRTIADLVKEWQANPKAFAWGGGSLGSVDQMIITQLALEAKIAAPEVNYIAYSGGGELATSLLSGTIKASCSGYEDFSDQIDAGRLRGIAVSAPAKVSHIPLPTLRDQGYPVTLTNWRGVVAPPGITSEQRDTLVQIITEVRDSPEWREALTRNGWTDSFQSGPAFEKTLREQATFADDIWSQLGY